MQQRLRLVVVIALAAFVAGFGVKAATSATMEFAMAMSDAAAKEMPSCMACDNDGEKAACDIDCTAPTATLLIQVAAGFQAVFKEQILARSEVFIGRGGPPDPYPPKPSILFS